MKQKKEHIGLKIKKIRSVKGMKQEELAKLRLEICLECEFRKEVVKGLKWSTLCGKCGCPLNKKVFSPNYNPCPLKKWDSVDSSYLEPFEDKNKNTLI